MHKIFSKENLTTFVFVVLAATVASVFVTPFVRKFFPKKVTTATAPTGT